MLENPGKDARPGWERLDVMLPRATLERLIEWAGENGLSLSSAVHDLVWNGCRVGVQSAMELDTSKV